MQLPEAFISRTKSILGDEWDAFEQSLQEKSSVSIRLNPYKCNSSDISEFNFRILEEIPWASDGFYLENRPVFTLDPLFHAGCYYVQEASSMYLEQIVKKQITEPCVALDLCAAPGGKSTHLSSLLSEDSLLMTNEVIRSRSTILEENVIKWGNPNVIVTNNDPKEIGQITRFFDVILADVPCSGEGMFRKDPDSIAQWSVGNVNLCAERQRRIIADSWPALKPGGLLIYSTCTYNRDENEENISWICRELGAEIVEDPKRFLPHKTKGEGFFIATVRKGERGKENGEWRMDNRQWKVLKNSEELKRLIRYPDKFVFLSENNHFRAIPKFFYSDYLKIKNTLKTVSAGINLAELKGKDLIPNHALAMSNELSLFAFPNWEVDKETALKFLRKESFSGNIPAEIPKGIVLVSYKNHPLGFIKNIGNRANNLYPQEWRIRMNINKSTI